MKLGLIALAALAAVFTLACQRPQAAPVASAPALTSAPLPKVSVREQVWRFDFVFTPKDPKDPTLTPTMFSVNIPDHDGAEVMIGRNVALSTAQSATSSQRQDVGLKVKAHVQPFETGNGNDMLMDVELELSTAETGTPVSSIRKMTSRGTAVAANGKSAQILSMEDDRRRYELTVTPTKLR
jgi:hypothetical protein